MNRNFVFGLIGLAALVSLIALAGLVLRQFSAPAVYNVHTEMPALQSTDNPLLIRTDFSDNEAWESLVKAVGRPVNLVIIQTRANLDLLNDPTHTNASPEQLIAIAEAYREDHNFMLIADARAMTERLVLVVDLDENPGASFRTPLAEVALIENNLTISNANFAEFAEMVDAQGVYRSE